MISYLALHLIMAAGLFQGCAAGNDLFEKTKARFDADRATTVSREAAQGYLQQFRRVVDLCPSNGAAWYYAYRAGTILNDPRSAFFKTQADMNGFAATKALVAPAAPKPGFDVSLRLTEETADGVLKEGEPFKLIATIKNISSVAASGIRLKVNGLPAVRDAVGMEHYVGDLAVGASRVIDLAGTIDNVVQDAGTINVEVTDISGARSE